MKIKHLVLPIAAATIVMASCAQKIVPGDSASASSPNSSRAVLNSTNQAATTQQSSASEEQSSTIKTSGNVQKGSID